MAYPYSSNNFNDIYQDDGGEDDAGNYDYPQHHQNEGYLSSSQESLPGPSDVAKDGHGPHGVDQSEMSDQYNPYNNTYRDLQGRHAGAATKYQLDQVDDQGTDVDSQIDSIIRNAPTSLRGKKELKSQYSKSKPPPTTTKISSWKTFKYSVSLGWTRFRYRVYDLSLELEVWRSSLKVVEGRFGTAVVSYFVFLKWLLFLNIYITLLVIGLMIVPQVIPGTQYLPNNSTEACEVGYDEDVNSNCQDGNGGACIIDFLEGSGWMEQTLLFYGHYFPYYVLDDTNYDGEEVTNKYDIPLAYLLTTVGFFVFSFLMMLNYTSTALKENLASSQDTNFKYCNKVFCGWDYLLTDNNSALLKKESIRYELKSDLDEESRYLETKNRTLWQKIKLYTLRIFLNMIVIAILVGAFYVIYIVTDFSIKSTVSPISENAIVQLIISFLPSIAITLLNGIIPMIFNVLVRFEDYSPQFEIAMTLLRTVFLRLASLVILFFSLYTQITCNEDLTECRFCEDSKLRCWETAVGQEFYKLALTDFAAVVVIVIAVEFPRKVAAKYLHLGIAKTLGEMEFEIPKNVLAIVYSQALCWIGTFFCPFLPVMTVAKFFVVFYLKKWSLLVNMIPTKRPFRASRSGIFFMVILLVTLLMCIAPVGYFITHIEPSKGCGPFRLMEDGAFIWNELSQSLEMWNSFVGDVLEFVGSVAFIVPLIIFLVLLLYYYSAIASAQSGMVNLLKEQLTMEGRDKHFLLTRIDDLIAADLRESRKVHR